MRQQILLLAALSLLMVACATGTDGGSGGAWGPLAVTDPEAGGQALMFGELIIDDGCVLLRETGEEVLLLWPKDQTGWDPATETILFETSDGAVLELRSGALLELAGGGNSTQEGGGTPESLVAGIDWVSQPDDACLRDIVWGISAVKPSTR
jgi:hypothetical protein